MTLSFAIRGSRTMLKTAGCAAIFAWLLFAGTPAAFAGRYLRIPPAAYTSQLGAFHPKAACAVGAPPGTDGAGGIEAQESECPAGDTGTSPFAFNEPAAQPGLGVPLGGVGAGSFMINQAGSFGPWDFGGETQDAGGPATQYEDRILPQAAFHVREQLGNEAAVTRTLAVNAAPWNQLPAAWNPLKAGEGEYGALWPFGWEKFKPFKAGVSMQFWSPIVAGNDELTSMPVAFFDVRLANTTKSTDKLSVMLTMPNAPEHVNASTVREGLSSSEQTDTSTGVTGVTLSASSPSNTPDAQNSDWTIAAKPAPGQSVSYTTSWNASGDGSDIYAAFSPSGQLPDQPLETSSSAGAIAVSVTLAPGQVTTIPFALSWDFPETTAPAPNWDAPKGQYWMRRYTSYFGAKETEANDYVAGSYPAHRGFAIADRMLGEHDEALTLVKRWWNRIANNSTYPSWLVREALNEEIQMTFNESFWESGLVTETPSPPTRVGAAVPGTHLFCTTTGGNWNDCNEWDTDAYGYLAEMLLWPSLERDRLRGVLQEKAQGITGVGETGATRAVTPEELESSAGRLQFLDIPMKTIFRSYAYYRRTGDKAFLQYAYPVMLKLLQNLQAGVHAPDHFPFEPGGQVSTYDAFKAAGHTIYNCELFLLTEEIMIDATQKARELGVPQATTAVEQQLKSDLPQAKEEFETLFWDPLDHHYILGPSTYGNGIFMDSLFAQNVATTLGLPTLVDPVREAEHLRTAYPQEMQERLEGHLVGPPNMVPNSGPVVADQNVIEENEVWPGAAMLNAGAYLQAGQQSQDPTLVNEGLEMAHSLEYWITEDQRLGFLFEAPESWKYTKPFEYRSPSMNRTRSALGVLNTIKPIVRWKVAPPSASLYVAP